MWHPTSVSVSRSSIKHFSFSVNVPRVEHVYNVDTHSYRCILIYYINKCAVTYRTLPISCRDRATHIRKCINLRTLRIVVDVRCTLPFAISHIRSIQLTVDRYNNNKLLHKIVVIEWRKFDGRYTPFTRYMEKLRIIACFCTISQFKCTQYWYLVQSIMVPIVCP